MLKITGTTFITAHIKGDKTFYSTTISRKNMNGEYENIFISVRFTKHATQAVNMFEECTDKQTSKIEVLDGWLSFYMNFKNQPVYELIINDYSWLGNYTLKSNQDNSQALKE